MRKTADWIAFAALVLSIVGGAAIMGIRLGALETKVEALVTTIALIAPPTVRVQTVIVPTSATAAK